MFIAFFRDSTLARSDTTTHHEAPRTDRRSEQLSDIERKILDFMVQYLRANTYQPSIREIGERFGIKSTKTVSEHLSSLAEKGYLERDPSRSRGVRILGVDLNTDTVSVPCFSKLPDGPELPDRGSAEMFLSIDERMGGRRGSYMVRASGGELAVLGVEDGDFVLLSPAHPEDVEDGAVVAARVDGRSGFHRVERNGRGTYLKPLNAAQRDATLDDAGVTLLGRVTALYRRMDEVPAAHLTKH